MVWFAPDHVEHGEYPEDRGRVGARWYLTGDSYCVMPFRALNLSPQILQAVRDSGYTEPTPIQIAAIPLILAGDDVIGIAQTGTGKTAAFVLPILMKLAESRQTVARHGELTANRRDQKHNAHRLRALVLAPTR